VCSQLGTTTPTWRGFDIPVLGPGLRSIRELYDAPLRLEVEIDNAVLGSPLGSWIADCILLSYTLDEVAATGASVERLRRVASRETLDIVESLQSLELCVSAVCGVDKPNPGSVADYSRISIPRLRAAAGALVGRLKAAADLPAMLAEWGREVVDSTAPPSQITQLTGGDELTRC